MHESHIVESKHEIGCMNVASFLSIPLARLENIILLPELNKLLDKGSMQFIYSLSTKIYIDHISSWLPIFLLVETLKPVTAPFCVGGSEL